MITAARHTGIVVRDLERSLKFYKDTLGLKIWKRATEKGQYIDTVVGIAEVVVEWVKLQVEDGYLIEILQYKSHPSRNTPSGNFAANKIGCSHIAFTTSDIDKLYEALCANGYECNNHPINSPDGLARVMYCYDPDGIIVELVQEL